jgi:short-chain fatty acids transporter
VGILAGSAARLTRWTTRWIPGSFTISVILTAVVLAGGWIAETTIGGAHPAGGLVTCFVAWGDGFWTLLTFGMQMCLVILTGYIIAVSAPVRRALTWFVRRPRTPAGVIVSVAFAAMALSWVNWGLGLVTGAMLVRIASTARDNVDYRLLTASAYLGLGTTWHAGPSGSAPLLMATPDHFLSDVTGVVPVTRTVLSASNLALVTIVAAVILVTVRLMVPGAAVTAARAVEDEPPAPRPPRRPTPAERLEHSCVPNVFFAALALAYLVHHFATAGAVLTLDVVNMTFLAAGILLHRTPASLVHAAQGGSRLLHGIVVQFPLYAGMFGIIEGTPLLRVVSEAFVSVSNRTTFPLVVTWYSGLLNYFVPSGGSKWAIEAPYLIEAARTLDVPLERLILAYSYGDMWTNLVQPFWALPILAAARLEFKDIMGYGMVFAAVYGTVVSVAMLLV